MFRLGDKVEIVGSANPIRHYIPIGSRGVIIATLTTDAADQEYYTVKSKHTVQRISPADLCPGFYNSNDEALHLLERNPHV